MTITVVLFLAGMLTIFLPCILPLVPIVLGVSIAGQHRLRPLAIVLGMVLSFVLVTYALLTVLNQFVEFSDYIRIGTYSVLLLFGAGFLFASRLLRIAGGIAAALFFWDKGPVAVFVAAVIGVLLMEIGGKAASGIQQAGSDVQTKARMGFGSDSLVTAFVIGATLGLVWVPCAGPALGLALTLVREEPGSMALGALAAYALGTAVPLLIVGYGGQHAVRSVRSLAPHTGLIKKIAGIFMILTAVGLHVGIFQKAQVWVTEYTTLGNFGSALEEALIDGPSGTSSSSVPPSASMNLPKLPTIVRAPEFSGLGPWHNSEPFTLASQKGKVVLVDFWTYTCINCIRTLPHMQKLWEKYGSTHSIHSTNSGQANSGQASLTTGKDTGKFVLIGVHSPEFTFEKSEKNVAMAIENHGLTYPVAQDNDFATWSAFANRYWPAKYLIDADGYIRYTHFGEGDYEETDKAIASLLAEIGMNVKDDGTIEEKTSGYRELTPEIYLSSRSWPAFGNQKGEPTDEAVTYEGAPMSLAMNKYYLTGTWKLVDDESQELVSDEGGMLMKFRGGEINLVLGLAGGVSSAEAEVTVDGKLVKTFTIDVHDLYQLFKGEYGEHELVLTLKGKGVQAFAFTFGQ